MIALATVRPPTPESKIPIGAFGLGLAGLTCEVYRALFITLNLHYASIKSSRLLCSHPSQK